MTPRALGQVEQRPHRRDERHLGHVDRRPDDGDRGDRQVLAIGGDEEGEDPAEAPADEVHPAAARVLADDPDRLGQHLVDPVLHAQRPVLEGDLPVLQQVGRTPLRDQVLDQGAAAPQVVAQRRRRQRRHEQDRVTGLRDARGRAVVVDLAQLPVVDQRPGHRPQVGQPAVEQGVRDVAGRGDHLVGLGDEVHGRNLRSGCIQRRGWRGEEGEGRQRAPQTEGPLMKRRVPAILATSALALGAVQATAPAASAAKAPGEDSLAALLTSDGNTFDKTRTTSTSSPRPPWPSSRPSRSRRSP